MIFRETLSPTPRAGFVIVSLTWGSAYAPPQALCFRLLRRLVEGFHPTGNWVGDVIRVNRSQVQNVEKGES
jgi:hypothetical protein